MRYSLLRSIVAVYKLDDIVLQMLCTSYGLIAPRDPRSPNSRCSQSFRRDYTPAVQIFNLSNVNGASIVSDEILTIRKHGTPHDAAIIDYQEERKLDAEQLFHHVYSGSSSLRRVYFEPEIFP